MNISKLIVNTKLDTTSPYYLQIAALIKTKIVDGSLTVGEKLPAERELALLFEVSRTTAINAYRHLEKGGYVSIKNGSGTYVSDRYALESKTNNEIPWPQLLKPYIHPSMATLMSELMVSNVLEDKISLDAGMPDPNYYPIDIFSKLHRDYLAELEPRDFGHIPVHGYEPLRHTITQMLGSEGIKCYSDEVIILSGSQQGLYLTARVLIEPGDYVIIQAPTYLGAIQVFQSLGARVLSLPQSEDFPFEILEDYLTRYRPKLLYCIPTFRNPTGTVMNAGERKKLIQLAARYRLAILEDDPYSNLYYEDRPPASLKALDDYGGVIYLSTFSKILMPGLRLGYMVAHPSFIHRIILEKQYVDLHSNNISQWLLDLFIKEGYLANHLIKMRGIYRNRRNVMTEALNQSLKSKLSFQIPQGGFYIWCKINENISLKKLLQEALKTGVSFVPGEAFYAAPGEDKEFRLCFSQHNEEIILEGISRLEKSIGKFKKSQFSISKREVRPII
ncbi:DNA-binding transcriptional regulator, MocR family, contains an aminotransferase domain [Anaerovirgula multivorans]|uniref:DNA-binding transcriptional regulator, MocR family, contains an aminotransferase domain n=1 Tax=Anaerovirgula multivorans TaxID=312168 RepID=A0A239F6D0_9FIRM|nr:PLP-dependent aminotransferase family protein [Anaerovirgula multivorans]SNS52365.1 DNA-binding transcriptional regulator, MocR family, contains an aminotransferase domain [Anaerovirgula multivorans]